MKASKLRALCRKYTYKKIIEKFMQNELYLTQKQLERICAKGDHHGGCYLGEKGGKNENNKTVRT